jgi:hypothetical protein
MSDSYEPDYYASIQDSSISAARAVIPLVIDLVRPRSVVDLGCGTGAWLAAVKEQGIDDILGIDGDWLPVAQLLIPHEQFVSHNLCQPLNFDRRFDLAISLETAEHLPRGCASTYIKSLVDLAPVVLFSAAIPQQGGHHHHNEQWPSYWADLFCEHDYLPIDSVRPLVWTLPGVAHWYAQNILIFAASSHIAQCERLKRQHDEFGGPVLPLLHPARWNVPASYTAELQLMRRSLKTPSAPQWRPAANQPDHLQRLVRLIGELRQELDDLQKQAEQIGAQWSDNGQAVTAGTYPDECAPPGNCFTPA